jgi:hypothetical protein
MSSRTNARSAAGARLFFLPPYSPDLNPIDPSAGSGGVRQAEHFPAKNRRARRRRHGEAHWNPPRRLQSRRMRKLFRQLRLRFRVESSRSSETCRLGLSDCLCRQCCGLPLGFHCSGKKGPGFFVTLAPSRDWRLLSETDFDEPRS